MKNKTIIDKKKKYMFPNLKMHFYDDPPVFVRGDMQYLFDGDGKKYTDFFAGVSVMICGHSNKEILTKTIEQLKRLQHTTIIYLDENIVRLAEKLANIMPGDIDKTFFCASGSEANEGAFLLSKIYTKKSKFITLENALHGKTYLTLGATTIKMWDIDPHPTDLFYVAKGFYNPNETLEESAKQSIESVREILKNNDDIASMIVEPIQGNGGILTPPIWYFKKLKKVLEEYDVLLIADEVQTGYGRTGKMFGMDNFDIVPDILVTAKALSGGIPIATFSTTAKIAKHFNKPSASTFGGTPVSCANSLAVLEYVENNRLVEKSKELGNYLIDKLKQINSDIIKEVRGIGLMIGVELECKNSPEVLNVILEDMKNKGFILGKCGVNRNVIALQPPLVITTYDIDNMILELENTICKIQGGLIEKNR